MELFIKILKKEDKGMKKETKVESKLSAKAEKQMKDLMKKFNFREKVVPGGYYYSVHIPTMDKQREFLLTLGVNTLDGYAMFAVTGKGIVDQDDCQTLRLANLKLEIFEKDIDLVEMYINDLAKILSL